MIEDYDYAKEWQQIADSENKHRAEVQDKKDKTKEQLRNLLDVEKVWEFLNDGMQWEVEGSVNVEVIEKRISGRDIAID